MRLMKLGSMSALTLGSLIALAPWTQGQDAKPATPTAPAAPATPQPGTPATPEEMRARRTEAQLKSMTRSLTLTEEQQAKIKPILEDQFKQYEELQQDKTVPMQDRGKKMIGIRDATQAKIRTILTAEQQQKLDAVRQRLQPRTPPAAPGAPGAPAAPPPAPTPAK